MAWFTDVLYCCTWKNMLGSRRHRHWLGDVVTYLFAKNFQSACMKVQSKLLWIRLCFESIIKFKPKIPSFLSEPYTWFEKASTCSTILLFPNPWPELLYLFQDQCHLEYPSCNSTPRWLSPSAVFQKERNKHDIGGFRILNTLLPHVRRTHHHWKKRW